MVKLTALATAGDSSRLHLQGDVVRDKKGALRALHQQSKRLPSPKASRGKLGAMSRSVRRTPREQRVEASPGDRFRALAKALSALSLSLDLFFRKSAYV